MTIASLFRPIVWAMLLAFISYPLYKALWFRFFPKRRSLAALVMTLSVLALLVVPAILYNKQVH